MNGCLEDDFVLTSTEQSQKRFTFGGLGLPALPVLVHLLIPQGLEVLQVHGQQGTVTQRAPIRTSALYTALLSIL